MSVQSINDSSETRFKNRSKFTRQKSVLQKQEYLNRVLSIPHLPDLFRKRCLIAMKTGKVKLGSDINFKKDLLLFNQTLK